MASVRTDYSKQGNCFAVYRNGVFMALFEMEYQADIFISAMIDKVRALHFNRTPSETELCAEWEKRTEFMQLHG